MIVEDHFVVREGLKAIINSQQDMVAVAEAGNGRQAVEAFEQHLPDVTLMDLRIPGLNGIDAISGIVEKHPRARIIVLSTYGGDENIFRAFQAGARAYFLKDIKGQDLVDAIRAVNSGQRVVPPEIASQLAERVPLTSLSPREMEILILVAKGKSNKEIGAALSISEGTVRVHTSNLLSKLRCSGRAQAVSEAIRRGIIEVE
ncbi:MAG: response regulator transcription factor [Bryobacteraceae bacterium]|jgi:DNA-binding NarL/FixJ family response regulator